VIVRCERCETRFKLDEARLPARGARVRCSRCKHAFFVIPPGASREELVDDVAAAAAEASNPLPKAPEPAWDLEDGAGTTATTTRGAGSSEPAPVVPPAPEQEDPNDWRFEGDLPGVDPGATRVSLDLTGAAAAPAFAPAPDANENSFADLGDPETWDLLSDDEPAAPTVVAAPPAETAAPVPAVAGAPAPVSAPAPAAKAESVECVPEKPPLAIAKISDPAPSAAATHGSVASAAHPAFAVRATGWAAALVLSAAVAWASLPVRAPAPVLLAPVAGFDVVEARVRILENATAGPMLVVSGTLRNPDVAPRTLGSALEVRLLDVDGQLLAGSAAAGPLLSERQLREEPPERLRVAQAAGADRWARRPVAAGGELGFDAVFATRPPAAASAVVTTQRGATAAGR